MIFVFINSLRESLRNMIPEVTELIFTRVQQERGVTFMLTAEDEEEEGE